MTTFQLILKMRNSLPEEIRDEYDTIIVNKDLLFNGLDAEEIFELSKRGIIYIITARIQEGNVLLSRNEAPEMSQINL